MYLERDWNHSNEPTKRQVPGSELFSPGSVKDGG